MNGEGTSGKQKISFSARDDKYNLEDLPIDEHFVLEEIKTPSISKEGKSTHETPSNTENKFKSVISSHDKENIPPFQSEKKEEDRGQAKPSSGTEDDKAIPNTPEKKKDKSSFMRSKSEGDKNPIEHPSNDVVYPNKFNDVVYLNKFNYELNAEEKKWIIKRNIDVEALQRGETTEVAEVMGYAVKGMKKERRFWKNMLILVLSLFGVGSFAAAVYFYMTKGSKSRAEYMHTHSLYLKQRLI
ncbi:hypothetical protein KXD40_008102 [Peronospora effusa]|nr:hypothetical protein KXD40_008102 [Peronospora effusa]